MVDQGKIQIAVRMILEAIGKTLNVKLKDQRVAKMYAEILVVCMLPQCA